MCLNLDVGNYFDPLVWKSSLSCAEMTFNLHVITNYTCFYFPCIVSQNISNHVKVTLPEIRTQQRLNPPDVLCV